MHRKQQQPMGGYGDIRGEIITLLDGRTLPCYPKPEAATPIDNSVKLDTTGQYLTIGRKRRRPRVPEPSPEIARSRKYGALLQKSTHSTTRPRHSMKPSP